MARRQIRSHPVRARDTDRARAVALLDAAHAHGELDGDEYRERTARAHGAETVGELGSVVADLQRAPSAAVDRPVTPGRVLHGVAWLVAALALAVGVVALVAVLAL
ncbi:DUF1707 domain-containing protein [Rhodococcus sp. HNM0569]|uniref:DUF1707 domain-containing protein n=1 Tax=Rhodococcus sp. HNM0569 TaxID=2716340 RepID=UPI00146F6202|nr:DUF1707 domain-containing protein [Rhodococcus sp. HNM0569]